MVFPVLLDLLTKLQLPRIHWVAPKRNIKFEYKSSLKYTTSDVHFPVFQPTNFVTKNFPRKMVWLTLMENCNQSKPLELLCQNNVCSMCQPFITIICKLNLICINGSSILAYRFLGCFYVFLYLKKEKSIGTLFRF